MDLEIHFLRTPAVFFYPKIKKSSYSKSKSGVQEELELDKKAKSKGCTHAPNLLASCHSVCVFI